MEVKIILKQPAFPVLQEQELIARRKALTPLSELITS
jgi:hypothetical protein